MSEEGDSPGVVVWLAVLAAVAAVGAGVGVGSAPTGDRGGVPAANGTQILHGGGALTLVAGPGQAVRGRTDLRPGAAVTVRVASGADDPYLRSSSVTVGADGLFRAVFDLSGVEPGAPLRVVVHRDGRNLTAAAGEVVACDGCPPATPATPSAVVTHDGDALTLRAGPGQVVAARTNLPPGTELTVQLRSIAGASPFIKQTTATVAANGTVRAVFDFEGVSQGSEFRVAVRHDGTELTTAPGEVACAGDCATTDTPGDPSAFADAEVGVVQAANGSVARVRLRLGAPDAALLTLRSPETTYAMDATVRDGDDDGVVVVLFDTAAAARGAAALSTAADADGVTVRDAGGRFRATDYRIALHPLDDASAEVATGLLVVTQHDRGPPPLLTSTPGRGVPLGSAAALVAGAALAVLGLGLVLGLVDPRAWLGRR